MVSAVSQAHAPAAESTENDSNENRHWLYGRYFVALPDLSDEARWIISQGRAWPVFTGLVTLLRRLELKGTEPQKAAACAGRIEHLGVNGLAAAIKMSPTATLRQLRFLERQGFIRTSQGTFTTEVDPATGRIARNYAKAPPKVVELTLRDSHYRPQASVKGPRGDTHETNPRPQGDTYEPNPRPSNRRVRNERVSRERTSKEVRSYGTNKRQDASGPRKGPDTPAAKSNPSSGPANRETRDIAVVANSWGNPIVPAGIANCLGLDAAEVAATPPGERREELIRQFYAKQGWRHDPATNRMVWVPPFKRIDERKRQPDAYATLVAAGEITPADDTLTVRQTVTAAVSLHDEPQEGLEGAEAAGDTLAQEEAAAGLREASAGMTPEGRDRARVQGEQIDERLDAGATEQEIDAAATELLALIEQKRGIEQEARRAALRDMAELEEAAQRQRRQYDELKKRMGTSAMRRDLAEG